VAIAVRRTPAAGVSDPKRYRCQECGKIRTPARATASPRHRAARYLVPLAPPRPRRRQGRGSQSGDGHRKSRCDPHTQKSTKGSKRLDRVPPRDREMPATPGLSGDDYAPVLILHDRHAANLGSDVSRSRSTDIARVMRTVVAEDALLVSDSRAAYTQFADDTGLLPIALNISKGDRGYGSYHVQNVNAT
jgi:hypothetical protein